MAFRPAGQARAGSNGGSEMNLTPDEDEILDREMEALDAWLDERAAINGTYSPAASAVVFMARAIILAQTPEGRPN